MACSEHAGWLGLGSRLLDHSNKGIQAWLTINQTRSEIAMVLQYSAPQTLDPTFFAPFNSKKNDLAFALSEHNASATYNCALTEAKISDRYRTEVPRNGAGMYPRSDAIAHYETHYMPLTSVKWSIAEHS